MINFIQLNQNITEWEENIITDAVWETIHEKLTNKSPDMMQHIHEISIQYNTDKKNIIKNFFNYVIRKKKQLITPTFLSFVEKIMHSNGTNIEHILHYFFENYAAGNQGSPATPP
jgi:ribosomal protein L19